MSSATSPPGCVAAVDGTPFLGRTSSGEELRPRRFPRRPSLRGATRFIRRTGAAAGRMREPSVRVREMAVEQLEERQSDWAYSKPVVMLDFAWNLAFVIVSATVLSMSVRESPSVPMRLWIAGYALQCSLHMVCVFFEYKRRRAIRTQGGGSSSSSILNSQLQHSVHFLTSAQDGDATSFSSHVESANAMFSFIWWIVGFYWISGGGESLKNDSPQLYWLCITFLAFDVFFVIICVAVACLVGVAVCCCLPCIIAILYAVTDQEGASSEDIDKLPKYNFRRVDNMCKFEAMIQEAYGGVMTQCNSERAVEHVLSKEDAECCICLCTYDDGAELRELPCGHHFHCCCIDRWLHINATCPLCKINILKCCTLSSSEEV